MRPSLLVIHNLGVNVAGIINLVESNMICFMIDKKLFVASYFEVCCTDQLSFSWVLLCGLREAHIEMLVEGCGDVVGLVSCHPKSILGAISCF